MTKNRFIPLERYKKLRTERSLRKLGYNLAIEVRFQENKLDEERARSFLSDLKKLPRNTTIERSYLKAIEDVASSMLEVITRTRAVAKLLMPESTSLENLHPGKWMLLEDLEGKSREEREFLLPIIRKFLDWGWIDVKFDQPMLRMNVDGVVAFSQLGGIH